jgi:hypothetical protein
VEDGEREREVSGGIEAVFKFTLYQCFGIIRRPTCILTL